MTRYSPLIFEEPDQLVQMTVMEHQARVMMTRVTRMTQDARDTHLASDAATAAMGRLLSAAAMMSCMIKEEKGSVTVTVAGDGAGGKMTAVGRHGRIKIAVENPQAELPLLSGKQDVQGFVGRHGRLTVIKDMGSGDPYIGSSELKSGELGEDLAQYLTVSEQVNSLVALGCLNQDGTVLSAGGILVQALPGCTEKTLTLLEDRIPFFANISRELYDRSIESLCANWFDGMDLKVMKTTPLSLACDCTREKMARALIATGRKELSAMVDEGKDIHTTCWFCRRDECFTQADLEQLIKEAADDLH